MRKQHMTHRQQSGYSPVQLTLIIGVVGFFILLGVKIVPAYLDNIYVKDALKFLAQTNPDIRSVDKQALRSQLNKYMIVNSIRDVQADSFKIKRYEDRLIINSVYEVRKEIVPNVDVVISFKNQLDTANPEACCEYLIESWDEKK